jgi:Uncharacterized protein conserved in bacteria (DUF2330)
MRSSPLLIGPALVLIPAAIAFACASAPPPGAHVDIGDESAVIVWDAASRTEHFIRRATFRTPAHDFGFLVPTPARPTLGEAGDAAFDHLAEVTAPQIVTKVVYEPGIGFGCMAGSARVSATADDVQVLEQTRVAGYDAAVLAADDPAALNRWLGEHGYESRPALTDWLAPYTKAGWTVTAFKMAKADTHMAWVGSSAVRMTFQTDRPFFPYREPADQRQTSATPPRRLLRIYFVGDGRFDGAKDDDKSWPGRTVWANALPDADRARLAMELALTIPATEPLWLTEFEDKSSPRPGTDEVYFSRSADQSPVARPPREHHEVRTWPDLMTIVLAIAVMAALGLMVRRKYAVRSTGG